MAKISLIGAGSVVFARRLLQDIVCVPELSDSTVSLMDTDAERLALMGKFAEKRAQEVLDDGVAHISVQEGLFDEP